MAILWELITFQISAPAGRPMQISVYRSQNGVWWCRKHPIGRHFVSCIHWPAQVCQLRRLIEKVVNLYTQIIKDCYDRGIIVFVVFVIFVKSWKHRWQSAKWSLKPLAIINQILIFVKPWYNLVLRITSTLCRKKN